VLFVSGFPCWSDMLASVGRSIKSVINYDAAKEIDTHVHRIGRTGRAGDKEGVAYTLVNANQVKAAGEDTSATCANCDIH